MGGGFAGGLGGGGGSCLTIQATVDGLRPVFGWDHLFVGGGNAKHLTAPLGEDVTVVPNMAGILGGVRVWDLDMAR